MNTSNSKRARVFSYRVKQGPADINRIFGGETGNDQWSLIGKRVSIQSAGSQGKLIWGMPPFCYTYSDWGQVDFRGL